ncbi:FAD-dependent oxidoreductase [Micromonospora sp. CPCC 206061]|uniref:FAD-dependent oxidoreductase n=1 Tax=Micromonospora sp. CPCC 206061 TaxID=3122410 RepID=UPI002FF024F8
MSSKEEAIVDVVVVGAGVVGLTSAVRLVEAGARVAVISADESVDTVSAVAAAVWYPTHTDEDPRVLQWATRTFEELCRQAGDGVPGVVLRPTRMLVRQQVDEAPWWSAAVPDFTRVPPPSAEYTEEWRFTVPTVEMRPYLDWLRDRLGGAVERRRIERFDEIEAPVVVNATGLAAGKLCGDADVFPARGRIVLVANPGLVTSVRDEDSPAGMTYIHPRSQDVVLGGTFEAGQWDTEPDARVGMEIVARCADLVPELANAAVLAHVAGLRPARRGGPRVEADPAPLPGGGRLVHNYGHGGAGVTLSWGCAEAVVPLAT